MFDDSTSTLQKAQAVWETLHGPTHAGGTVGFGSAMQKLNQARYRVCMITTQTQNYGTGFLVGPKWVLTNYHVVKEFIENRKEWSHLEMHFDFEGYGAKVRTAKLDSTLASPCLYYKPNAPIDRDPYSDFDQHTWDADHIDFALLQLQDEVGFDIVEELFDIRRGWMTLSPQPVWGGGGIILQFPQGNPLRWDFAGFAVPQFNNNRTRVRYLISGDHGSSGSPCLNNNADVIALHHAGRFHLRQAPHEKKNQGIPIECIVAALKAGAPGFAYIGVEPPLTTPLSPVESSLFGFLQSMITLGEDMIIRATAARVLGSCPGGTVAGVLGKKELFDLVRLAQCEINGNKFESALRAARLAVPGVASAPIQPNYAPLFLGPDSPWIDRQDLGGKARQLLEGANLVGLCVNGEPDTGRSQLYYYFLQLRSALDFRIYRIDLARVAAAGHAIIDALQVAKEINRVIGLGFPFSSNHQADEVFKTEEFRTKLNTKWENEKKKTIIYLDGLDAAAATNEAVDFIAALLDLVVENSLALRFVMVGVTREALKHKVTCVETFTRNFSEDDVINWFEAAFGALAIAPGKVIPEEERLKAIGEVLGAGKINDTPNVKRVGETAASVYSRFAF
jgi:hypothetical protein